MRHDGAGRGHAGEQFLFRVLGGNHDRVSHHVACGRGVQTDFLHGTVKRFVLEGVHGERDALALFHLADVSFIYVGHHLHLVQVLGDYKQSRSAHGSSHRLADFYGAFQNHPVNGALDSRIAQVKAGLIDFVLAAFYGEFRRIHIIFGGFKFHSACGITFGKFLDAVIGRFLVLVVGFGATVGDFGLRECGLELGLVEFRDDLALFDLGIEIGINFGDVTRHLRTDFHLVDGFQRSRCRNSGRDCGLHYLGTYERARGIFGTRRKKERLDAISDSAKNHEDDEDFQKLFHKRYLKIESLTRFSNI